jgi:hypothetical protein
MGVLRRSKKKALEHFRSEAKLILKLQERPVLSYEDLFRQIDHSLTKYADLFRRLCHCRFCNDTMGCPRSHDILCNLILNHETAMLWEMASDAHQVASSATRLYCLGQFARQEIISSEVGVAYQRYMRFQAINNVYCVHEKLQRMRLITTECSIIIGEFHTLLKELENEAEETFLCDPNLK